MAITTLVARFTQQDKHVIMDAVTNDTPLLDKWAFTDKKGHKCATFAWLSGHPSPKKSIALTTSFSPSIGQKHPLEADQDADDFTYADKLQAIKYHLPLPQSTVDVNLDAWMETINKYLDNAHILHTEINPTTLRACTIQAAEKLMKREYFINKIRKLARTKDQNALQAFEEEQFRSLQNEINLTVIAHSQDAVMADPNENLTKMDLIHKTTMIWRNTAKTLWKDNILTCNQETLDQATPTTTNKEKIDLIKKQGWETAKCNVTQNPTKFSPINIPLSKYSGIISNIVNNLKDKEDDSWELKIIKDIKNKGIQSRVLESRIQAIVQRLNNLGPSNPTATSTPPTPQPPSWIPSTEPVEPTDQEMTQADPIPWTDTEEYKQNCQLWINSASETFEKLAPYFPATDRKQKEELFWEAADICAHQDKELLQLQSISSFTDSNKKHELKNMRKLLIDKEYQSLLNATIRQEAAQKKDDFEDYLTMKDFNYYVQHTKEQLSNPAISREKKSTLKKLLKDAETVKWQLKHWVDDDGSILPDSPPPSPAPKSKQKSQKKKEDTRKVAEQTRKGNTLNMCHLQKLLNELNADNGLKIMKEIHKISDKDRINSAKQQLVKPTTDKPSYAQKTTPKDKKDPQKDGAGSWKMVGGNNKISRPTILPPPPNIFKFFITDDESTLLAKKQSEEELTTALNNIISENIEWLIELGSNHVKSANWSKDPKAIVVTMTCNINKNRVDELPDGKVAFDALQEVVLDLFPGATLAN
ncbi:hypothetical protein AMATHDRAFT_8646 [Amanita thiersii Skay4041]|uniref:Uncharacterized protein n=1 Tax=Amanita thiersii Skay4041 TaxID=703135 RepID=A0A2A9NDK8_9AGAR|nr:hypothetical protein AMATHDRAFT_8646 [Amanita thiersii Skay4041]